MRFSLGPDRTVIQIQTMVKVWCCQQGVPQVVPVLMVVAVAAAAYSNSK